MQQGLYSLMIGNEVAGDFHDWPETWQRTSATWSKYQSPTRGSSV